MNIFSQAKKILVHFGLHFEKKFRKYLGKLFRIFQIGFLDSRSLGFLCSDLFYCIILFFRGDQKERKREEEEWSEWSRFWKVGRFSKNKKRKVSEKTVTSITEMDRAAKEKDGQYRSHHECESDLVLAHCRMKMEILQLEVFLYCWSD